MPTSTMYRIKPDALDELIQSLRKEQYTVIGPTHRGGAIVLDTITSANQLPVGKVDEQAPASYRLGDHAEKTFFGFSVGPHSWKRYLFPPSFKIVSATKNGESIQLKDECDSPESSMKYALFGVRACDLNAIQIQDKVFGGGAYRDTSYLRLRHQAFIVAVNCTRAGGTCFCSSVRSGPRVNSGFDLAITEVLEGGHYFTVEVGTDKGEAAMSAVTRKPATGEEIERAEKAVQAAAQATGRSLEPDNTREALYSNTEHPRWDVVGARCLSCANCTMVCPTCFCTTVEDVTDLTGSAAERVRKWDSCFTLDFSYIHGGSVRSSSRARYRHWLTHKLGSWVDQFGTLGCVGCGRCITWCPVGIDITEEYRIIRETYLINSRGKS